MPLETLILYIIAAFVVVIIPGPLSLFMVGNSVRYGIIKSYPAFLGGTLASCIYLIISAAGIGVLIIGSPQLYLALKILGAGYLIYLGIATFRSAVKPAGSDIVRIDAVAKPNFMVLFKKAFLLGASNPKDIIFFIAFLPQFISPQGNLILQISIIVIVWIVVDIVCKIFYGLLAHAIRPFLQTPNRMSKFDKTSGGLYITAGVVSAVFL